MRPSPPDSLGTILLMTYHDIPELDFGEDILHIEDYDDLKPVIRYMSAFSNTDIREVENKNHIAYFRRYFTRMKAKKILVEYPYIDKDYLADYAAYYASSFADYRKKTIRVHFFSDEHDNLTPEFLKDILCNTGEDGAAARVIDNSSYLGYIVIKPIPKTMIGKTVLRTYPGNEEGRNYPIKRSYSANICGMKLHLDSIGYQEQDKSVAACATSALWSVFQSTGHLFQHPIPSPAEITKLATENSYFVDRAFPSKGLSLEQISNCIKALNLEPQSQDINEYNFLRAFIHAYQYAKIPTLLGTSLYCLESKKFLGEHAVAVMGSSTGFTQPSNIFGIGQRQNRLYLSSSRIDKIFVHDDQIGPFAKMDFDDPFNTLVSQKETNGATTYFASLHTSWRDKENGGLYRAIPSIVIVPLYHKIRIPFDKVFMITHKLNSLINFILEDAALVDEWDILLDVNSNFKEKILKGSALMGADAERILKKPLPRFLWRIKGIYDNEVRFEFLVDATDIAEGNLFLDFVPYHCDYLLWLNDILKENIELSGIQDKHSRYFLGKMTEMVDGLAS